MIIIEYQEFLSNIKAGQYVKIEHRRDTKYVSKVSKITRTQIVISEWGYADEPRTDRFRISSGCRIGDDWFYLHQIIQEPVTPEEAAAYEERIAEGGRMRKERKRLAEIEAWAKAKLFALFGEHIPAENIQVTSSRDAMKMSFFEIKCEKISEESLVAALGKDKAESK